MKESQVELKKNVKLLVHNAMEEHIVEFLNSSTFDNIVNLYRLPTAILAFTDCKKKVKAQYPEVDIKLGQDRDKEGRTIFPPNFDFEFVIMEEGNAEAKDVEVEESQAPHPVEIHPVPSEEDRPAPPTEDQPPPLAE
ncbi:hypothetical protein SLEP1_g7752 [Rubroshorea leprosula]|uniref:Uncharacterized protein n=1 Tax=Rubroshorea leprosula TaxID=152421 RepID=A0AAV5I3Z9_9ROSI|nr:hypothetical protein SLEP1_g7752 [Rubroshorea leprosula]